VSSLLMYGLMAGVLVWRPQGICGKPLR
jgi:branched-subunit amino acid ABC-type transport system permease component